MKINVHGGHNKIVTGASKYLNEVIEDRKVKDEVIRLLKLNGHSAYDCTDEIGKTQNVNLKNIVKKCNSNNVDYDISIHLNAGGGHGVEVLYYSNNMKDVASRVSKNISSTLGIANRGAKKNTGLYVLNSTKAPALLIECCFVDSIMDRDKWSYSKCAKAIVEGILNKNVITTPSSANKKVNAYYRVKTQKHGWLTEVKNVNDYAGYQDSPITDIAIKVDKGSIKYRVHVKGGSWLGWVTGYDIKNSNKYAGNGKPIDAVQIYYTTPSDIRPFKRAKYKTNYSWQYDDETKNGQDGYAGSYGKNVTKLYLEIV